MVKKAIIPAAGYGTRNYYNKSIAKRNATHMWTPGNRLFS